MKGNVKAISQQNRSVLIEDNSKEEWYDIADNVKLDYVKKGMCEFSVDEENIGPNGNPALTFIRHEGGQTNLYARNTKKNSYETDEQMKRMSALKSSSRIYEGTGKEKEFKKLTNECLNYIKTGRWENE